MLSGNGRHRRPRQAPAFVVAAGVTGSAIAIPLLGAGSASAADTATWDRLAECESGGAWSTNAGNGYYGGLQVTQELWERHGGLSYAPSADLASRSQQIVVAERILDAEGTAAWATCAPAIGLKQGGESADVNPGVPSDTGTPSASPASPAGKGKDKGDTGDEDGRAPGKDNKDNKDDRDNKDEKGMGEKKEKGDTASAVPSTDPTSIPDGHPSASPDEETSEGRGDLPRAPSDAPSVTPGEGEDSGGRHRGGTAAEPGSGESREGSGRHASRGDRGDAPDASGAYTVKEGDSLSVIAWLHEVDGGWPALYEANKGIVGDDADHILPGQALDLGSDPAAEKDRIGR
ncbi:Resuscitation-promoting factor RpfA precursor [Streptomyces sp. ADI96-15]|uniref:transglycosylase family protein n=1 Tax=Streptomyces TaxID=1883 RepID=UPI000F557895|nr:transglycosylase family protein [Streptomyces sp. ADI96-15]RPK57949.1 Resuscitation-promoting factor RpfA precursor [Streptomyces sp. ADI96-15]